MLAACTATLSKRPSVSTRMWRLRPLIFLPASKPCGRARPPFLRALGTLAVDDRRGRACLPSRLLAYRHIKRVMNALQRAIPGPQVEIGPYRALRRQVLGQRLPLAARRQHVENAVQNLAHIDRALAAAVLGGGEHGLDNHPFGVNQITWITKTAAVCCSKAVFRLPHRALPPSQIRESSAQQNHNRFIRLNNFVDRLLGTSPSQAAKSRPLENASPPPIA